MSSKCDKQGNEWNSYRSFQELMGVNRSWPEMTGKGPDRRCPETVLELLGSNTKLWRCHISWWMETIDQRQICPTRQHTHHFYIKGVIPVRSWGAVGFTRCGRCWSGLGREDCMQEMGNCGAVMVTMEVVGVQGTLRRIMGLVQLLCGWIAMMYGKHPQGPNSTSVGLNSSLAKQANLQKVVNSSYWFRCLQAWALLLASCSIAQGHAPS